MIYYITIIFHKYAKPLSLQILEMENALVVITQNIRLCTHNLRNLNISR